MDDKEKEKQEIQEKAEREAEEKAAKENPPVDAPTVPAPAREKEKAAPRKSFLEEARELDKSIKEGTIKIQELLEKNEKLLADALISGKGVAGDIEKPETEEEKWAKDAKIRYAGTGMDPTPDEEDAKAK